MRLGSDKLKCERPSKISFMNMRSWMESAFHRGVRDFEDPTFWGHHFKKSQDFKA